MKHIILALLVLPMVIQSVTCIYAEEKYLGRLSANKVASDSTSNPVGQYGSPVLPDSVNNPVGRYGSSVSSESARNPLATNAPRVVYGGDDEEGE